MACFRALKARLGSKEFKKAKELSAQGRPPAPEQSEERPGYICARQMRPTGAKALDIERLLPL